VARGALLASERVRSTEPALVDGTPGLVMAPDGRLVLVLRFAVTDDLITRIEVIADPDRLRAVQIALLEGS
jgi:RNA polymerase sigma-70 factor (ECF subfamily)